MQRLQSHKAVAVVKIVDANQPGLPTLGLGIAHRLHHAGGRRFGNVVFHQFDGGFKKDTGGVAVGIALDAAAGRVGGVLVNAGQTQSRAVDPGGVAAAVAEVDGVVGSNGVKLLGIGKSHHVPIIVFPAAPAHPFPGRGFANFGGNAPQRFAQATAAIEVDALKLEGVAVKMHVGIYKAGGGTTAVYIHHLAPCPQQRSHVVVIANTNDNVVANSNGRCGGSGGIHGVKTAVNQNSCCRHNFSS